MNTPTFRILQSLSRDIQTLLYTQYPSCTPPKIFMQEAEPSLCDSKLGHQLFHLFKLWFVRCRLANLYLNQWQPFRNWIFENMSLKFLMKWCNFLPGKCVWKCRLQNTHFVPTSIWSTLDGEYHIMQRTFPMAPQWTLAARMYDEIALLPHLWPYGGNSAVGSCSLWSHERQHECKMKYQKNNICVSDFEGLKFQYVFDNTL